MRTRPVTYFAGVLGWPLKHSLSPVIQNAAFRHLGLDWIYLAFPVPVESLAAAVAGLRALGAMGANVTMPHKESVTGLLDEMSGDARTVGAVNTIQRVGDKLIGHNTDVDGFREFLIGDIGISVAGKRAVVLGAGGAARAVVKALDDLGAARISIVARNPSRAEAVTPLASRGTASVEAWERASDLVSAADIIVNATPLGMDGADPATGAAWSPGQVVVDLVYDPPVTPLVAAARSAGAEGWTGLGMLVHQAAASLRIWTGQDPPLEAMSAAAVHALGTGRRFPDTRLN